MATFFDTHAHLDFPEFSGEVDMILQRAREAGITRVLCVGTDLDSSRQAVALSEAHPSVFAVVGWHPTHVQEAPQDVRQPLSQLARHPKVVAIGETGLDYYRMPGQQPGGSPDMDEPYRLKQAQCFQQQLDVAADLGLNVVVHQRGPVLEETLALMAPFAGRVRGQFHCFTGSPADLQRVLDAGSLVSFTGIVTFKNAHTVRQSLAAAPSGQFFFETDSPYLAPEPYRGRRCEPAYVREIAAQGARARGCSLEELSRQTCQAACDFFPKLIPDDSVGK